MPNVSTIKVILPEPKIIRIGVGTAVPGQNFSLNGSIGSVSLVAGSNISLQSNASTITINADVPAGANFSLNASTGSVSLIAGSNISLSSNASSITIHAASAPPGGTQSFSGGGTSVTGNALSIALVGGNNISLASASGAGSLTLTFNASSNALNNVSLLNGSSGAISVSAGAGIGIGQANSTITVSASNQTSSLSYVAALGTAAALSSGSITLVAGNNITLQTGANVITISAAATAGAATQSLSAAGTSVTGTAVSLDIEAGNNITLATATAAGHLSVSIAGVAASAQVVSAFGTGAATSTGTIVLAAGNNITLDTGAGSITIVGPTVPAATNFVLNGTSSSVSISAGAGIGIGQANSTITISASVQTSSVSLTALGNTTGSSSGTFSNLLNISGAGIVSVGVGAGSITISASSAAVTNFSTISLTALGNTTSSSTGSMNNLLNFSGAGIASVGVGAGTVTISVPAAAAATVSLTALGNTTSSSSGTFAGLMNVSGAGGVSVGAGAQSLTISGPSQTTLVAGSNISLTSGGSSITINWTPPVVSLTQNDDLGLVAGTIVSKAGTVTGTAGVGSSLFLQRLHLPAKMSVSEVDVALSIGFPVTSQGAGTMSRSFVLYSFGNSTSLASVASASATYAWTTGTSTAGASSSLTQFQGGWSSPLIQPMTFASTLVTPGDYVVGQLFNFAQVSSTWTLNFYGVQAASTFLASAGTAVTSASLGALSSGGLAAGSGITGIASLGSQWWPMMASQGFTGSNSMSAFTMSVASSAATSNTKSAVISVFAAANSAQLNVVYAISNSASLPISALSTVAGSIIGTSGSINAVTNVAMSALSSSTLAQLGLPNFGFIGAGSTTSGFPTAFLAGIMSTGAVPVAITLTSAAVTYSGSAAFQQPWWALAGN